MVGLEGPVKRPTYPLAIFIARRQISKTYRQEYLTSAFSFPMLSLAFQPECLFNVRRYELPELNQGFRGLLERLP